MAVRPALRLSPEDAEGSHVDLIAHFSDTAFLAKIGHVSAAAGPGRGRCHCRLLSKRPWYMDDPATDWDKVYRDRDPRLTEFHRGMRLWPDDDVYDHVTDESRPVAERAHALLRHVGEQMREQDRDLGMHWTDDPSHAQRIAKDGGWNEPRTPAPEGREDCYHIPVALDARWPDKGDIEKDKRVLDSHAVTPYWTGSEGEIPLRHGAPATVTGIRWAKGDSYRDPWITHTFDHPVRYDGEKFDFEAHGPREASAGPDVSYRVSHGAPGPGHTTQSGRSAPSVAYHEATGTAPDAHVDVYRMLPEGVTAINPGDWVSLHGDWTQERADSEPGHHVVHARVPASHVWLDAAERDDDEAGYHGPPTEGAPFRRQAAAQGDDVVDLYHHTYPESAEAIYRERHFEPGSDEDRVYFTNMAQGGSGESDYGTGVVHLRMPRALVNDWGADPHGEHYYDVSPDDIRPEHFVDPKPGSHEAAAQPVTAPWDASGSEKTGVYLRFGHWPENERSFSPAGGYHEDGVSAYDLDRHGDPAIDHGLDRGHVHDDDCDVDEFGTCEYSGDPWHNPDNDPREEMQGRVSRAEKNRRWGDDKPHETGHLVRGEMTGVGYDGEPLLQKVRRVGDWIDHRHLFIPGAQPHRLARDPSDEDYEPPEEQPQHAGREAASRPGRDERQCPCCKGAGSHGSDSCEACDGDGHVGRSDQVEHCPGEPQPRRRHWREASMPEPDYEPSAELPVGRGIWYRAHLAGQPLDEAHATSKALNRPWPGNPGADHPGAAQAGQNGYSAFAHPQHLRDYMHEYGWVGEPEVGWDDREVVAFHGRQVGRGADNEPLVHPEPSPACCGNVIHSRMPWEDFEQRLPGAAPLHPKSVPPWKTMFAPDPTPRSKSVRRHYKDETDRINRQRRQERHQEGRQALGAAIPPAERHESVRHILDNYRPYDFPTWDEVRDNNVWDHPRMRDFVDDVRRNGVQRPIPIDYEQDPPQVRNGHTRLLAAERAGIETVPTRQHQGWVDPDDPGNEDMEEPEPKEGPGSLQYETDRIRGRQGALGAADGTMSVEDLLELHSNEALTRKRHFGDRYAEHGDDTKVRTVYDRKAADIASNPAAWGQLDEPIRNGTIDPVLLELKGSGHTVVTEGQHRIVRAHQLGVSHLPVSYRPDSQEHRYEWEEPEPLEEGRTASAELLGHFEAAGGQDYRMQHQGPSADDGEAMHEVGSGGAYPADIHEHPDWYIESDGPGAWDSWDKVRKSRGWPSRRVTMYRSLPSPHRGVNTGDWVSSSADYARQHGAQQDPADDWPVVKFEARADQLRTEGNSINEWSYHGPPIQRARVHYRGGRNHWGKGDGGKIDADLADHEPPEMHAAYNEQTAERRRRIREERERQQGLEREAAVTAPDVVAHFEEPSPAPAPPPARKRAARQREGDERPFGWYTMRYRTDDQGERKPRHVIESTTPDGTVAGRLTWYGTTGRVYRVEVAGPEDNGTGMQPLGGDGLSHRRRGLATAMWDWSQEMTPRARHSGDQTQHGKDWAAALGRPRKEPPAGPPPSALPAKEAAMAVLGNPHTGGHEWYHGSPYRFGSFGDDQPDHPLLYHADDEDGSHWNTLLGHHFAASHQVAEEFGRGEHSPDPEGNYDDATPQENIIHARLGIRNPKVYRSEHDMDQEAYEHEWQAGNHHDAHHDPELAEEADEYGTDDLPPTYQYRGHGDRMRSRDEADPVYWNVHRTYHPYATGWLNSHPDKGGIAQRFRDRLLAQGHDGIVYGNEFEGSQIGKGDSHHVAALPFGGSQIDVTQRHTGPDCIPEEEATRQWPGRHQPPLFDEHGEPHTAAFEVVAHFDDPRTAAPLHMQQKMFDMPHAPRPRPEDPDWAPRSSTGWRYNDNTYGILQARSPEGEQHRYYTDESGLGDHRHPSDMPKPLYHGSHEQFEQGDHIEAGHPSHFADEPLGHVYMTEHPEDDWEEGGHGKGARGYGRRVYEVRPTGWYGHRSDAQGHNWATQDPVEVVREVPDPRERTAALEASGAYQGYFDEETPTREPGSEEGPFWHGTPRALEPGRDQVTGDGFLSYFTPRRDVAWDYATAGGRQAGYIYHVSPSGRYHVDDDETGIRSTYDPLHIHAREDAGSSRPQRTAALVAHFDDDEEDPDGYHGDEDDREDDDEGDRDGYYERHEAEQAARQATLPYVSPPPEGEILDHLTHMHGVDPRTFDLHLSPASQARWHDQEHAHRTSMTHQHAQLRGTPGERQWPDAFQLSEHTDFAGGTPGHGRFQRVLSDPSASRPFAPLMPSESSLHMPAADDGVVAHFGGEAAGNPACYYCGEPLDDEDVRDGQSAHEECSDMRWCEPHQEHHDSPAEAKDHNSTYTDWADHLPFEGGIHRGLTVRLPGDVHAVVHDDSRPSPERSAAMARHLQGEPLGVHWTDHEQVARNWGSGEGAMFGPSREERSDPSWTHLVVHAASPHEDDIETDPEALSGRAMFGFDHPRSEREVPLRDDAPVHVTGFSWKRADRPDWQRHNLPGPVTHTAALEAAPGASVTASYDWEADEGPFEWDEIAARHPQVYGEHDENGYDGPQIADAAAELYHDRPGHPYSESTGELNPAYGGEMLFHPRTVDPRRIDYISAEPGDARVRRARQGYESQRPERVPPLILVHRHGVYNVADGHHRAKGAFQAGKPVRAYVAYSPHDEPFAGRYGEPPQRAPFHGAELEDREPYPDQNGVRRRITYPGFPHAADVPTPGQHTAAIEGGAVVAHFEGTAPHPRSNEEMSRHLEDDHELDASDRDGESPWEAHYQEHSGYHPPAHQHEPFYHGTSLGSEDEEDAPERITPQGAGHLYPGEHTGEHAFATTSLPSAWGYAEKAWAAGRGEQPRVLQVRPTGPFEEDPPYYANGTSRGVGEGAVRSLHPWEVTGEEPVPEHLRMSRDEDDERGEHEGSLGGDPDDDHDEGQDPDRYVHCGQGHEHWGANGAAGMLIRHHGDDGQTRYLLQQRSPYVQHGGTWSTPGGALAHGESPEEGAWREAEEELGPLPGDITHHHTHSDDHDGWAYHTVVADSPRMFEPHGGDEDSDWESSGHRWVTPQEMRGLPLHPGFAASWEGVRKSGALERPIPRDHWEMTEDEARRHLRDEHGMAGLAEEPGVAHWHEHSGDVQRHVHPDLERDFVRELNPGTPQGDAFISTPGTGSIDPVFGAVERQPSFTWRYQTYGPDGGYVDREQEVEGPFYHGSRSKRLREGDEVATGRKTNAWGDEGSESQWVHFTTDLGKAREYASQAGGHVYEVEPTGEVKGGYLGDEWKSQAPLRVRRRIAPEAARTGMVIAAGVTDQVAIPAAPGRVPVVPAGAWIPETAEEAEQLVREFPAFLRALHEGLEALAARMDDQPVTEEIPAIIRRMAAACLRASEDADGLLPPPGEDPPEGTWQGPRAIGAPKG